MGGAESAGRRVFVFCKVVFPEKQLRAHQKNKNTKKEALKPLPSISLTRLLMLQQTPQPEVRVRKIFRHGLS